MCDLLHMWTDCHVLVLVTDCCTLRTVRTSRGTPCWLGRGQSVSFAVECVRHSLPGESLSRLSTRVGFKYTFLNEIHCFSRFQYNYKFPNTIPFLIQIWFKYIAISEIWFKYDSNTWPAYLNTTLLSTSRVSLSCHWHLLTCMSGIYIRHVNFINVQMPWSPVQGLIYIRITFMFT